MAGQPASPTELEHCPLTPERWADFERLFGPRGACAGCWCMWWRAKRSEIRPIMRYVIGEVS